MARGALVVGVDDNGPMKSAGVEPGDVVVKFDGRDIKGMQELHAIIRDTPPGKQVEVVVVRDGNEDTKLVTVARLADALAFYQRGRDSYFNQLDYEHALADYNEAIRLDPKLAVAYGGRGAVYEKQRANGAFIDPNDRAFTDYRTALALTPGDQWAAAGVKRLEKNNAPALADLVGTASAFSDPVGGYAISGTNPDGTTYTGEVVVEPIGDKYQVSWTVAGRKSVGIGVRYLDFLAVSFRAEDDTRVALLAQEGEGRLGVWARGGNQRMGSERWARGEAKTNPLPGPAANPEGGYAVSGANADGSTYTGDVVVTRVGDIFQVAKTIAGQKSTGAGIADGDFFAVSYRSGNGIQVALLTSRGSGEIGVWVDDGSNRLGAERWIRK